MPRTTTVEASGCPPLRALTFDALGLTKVVEARNGQGGVPKVVERWGDPDPSKKALAVSIIDRKHDPILAVARQNGQIEFFNPLNGDVLAVTSSVNGTDCHSEEVSIVGLHLLRTPEKDFQSKSCTFLKCTTKGNASVTTMELTGSANASDPTSSNTWNVCGAGKIECSQVDESGKYGLFGGKGVEVNLWDIDTCVKKWVAKLPPTNSLGIYTPTWFTSAIFLSKDDHRKLVAGTNNHQVRLYDISSQRRPVVSFDFRETPIKALAADENGYAIYVGNGAGDLACVDIRTGKLLGCFIGKCSGSIRSIAKHPDLPVIASCGLDSYLRIWDTNTRQLLSAVFLKQHLNNVVFDSNFVENEATTPAGELHERDLIMVKNAIPEDEQTVTSQKKKRRDTDSKEEDSKKKKHKQMDKGKMKKFEKLDEGDTTILEVSKSKPSKHKQKA